MKLTGIHKNILRMAFLLVFLCSSVFINPGSALALDQFVGEIRMFAGNFAPTGWAMCNGQIIPISQNTALFSLLGTTYGGDGETTFALPDLQGRVPIQTGQGPGLSQYDLGQQGGSDTVTLLQSETPSHTHTYSITTEAGSYAAPEAGKSFARVTTSDRKEINIYAAPETANSTLTIEGGGQPHNNMQPYLVVNYIIATQGIFPSRP
jgi:microcystin-dependent protein